MPTSEGEAKGAYLGSNIICFLANALVVLNWACLTHWKQWNGPRSTTPTHLPLQSGVKHLKSKSNKLNQTLKSIWRKNSYLNPGLLGGEDVGIRALFRRELFRNIQIYFVEQTVGLCVMFDTEAFVLFLKFLYALFWTLNVTEYTSVGWGVVLFRSWCSRRVQHTLHIALALWKIIIHTTMPSNRLYSQPVCMCVK